MFSENIAQSMDGTIGGKGLEILSCENDITIVGCTFEDNQAVLSYPNLNLNEAKNVSIKGSHFKNTKKTAQNKFISGNFIASISESFILIEDSTFDAGSGL